MSNDEKETLNDSVEKETFILETRDGDIWEFDNLEEARKNKWIFGGKIIKEVNNNESR